MATQIGAGIVFVPYTVLMVGIPMASIVAVLSATILQLSIVTYMRTLPLLPFPVSTIYDLGYIVVRSRFIVYLISLTLILQCGTLTIIYLILFGDITASIADQQLEMSKTHPFLKSRALYVMVICGILLPLFFSKKLKELKFISLILGVAFGIFFATFVY
jgi:amino acid permease